MHNECCTICPRRCNINRTLKKGFCGETRNIRVAKAYLHMWEEPCISGRNGSGTVFFTGCNLRCVFCQNHKISQENTGREVSTEELAKIFLNLQEQNAHNINLVSPSHFIPWLAEALKTAKSRGLRIPVIYNSNAYESVDALKLLEGLIDVYLPDLKYYDDGLAQKYSSAPNYFKTASSVVLEMYRQVGSPVFDDKGLIRRGLIIRHLVLPSLSGDSKKILKWIRQSLPPAVYISLMSQYTPVFRAPEFPEINRRVAPEEYDDVVNFCLEIGLDNGYIQEMDSAIEAYVPNFDLEGVILDSTPVGKE